MAKEIIISAIKAQLEAGITRKEINAQLELNPREIKALWSHPALKGIKVAKFKNELVFLDGISGEGTTTRPVDLSQQ